MLVNAIRLCVVFIARQTSVLSSVGDVRVS